MRVGVLACSLLLACTADPADDDTGADAESSSSSSSTETTSTTETTSSTSASTTVGTTLDDTSSEGESSSGAPACDEGSGEPEGYAARIEPIVADHCSCHRAGSPAGLSLRCGDGYGELVDVESTQGEPLVRVLPGDVTQSYMWLKLTSQHVGAGGSGEQMPLNRPPLSTDELATIQGWIEAGAPP